MGAWKWFSFMPPVTKFSTQSRNKGIGVSPKSRAFSWNKHEQKLLTNLLLSQISRADRRTKMRTNSMDTARHKPFRSHAFINSCFGSKLSITLILERQDFLASFIARPRKSRRRQKANEKQRQCIHKWTWPHQLLIMSFLTPSSWPITTFLLLLDTFITAERWRLGKEEASCRRCQNFIHLLGVNFYESFWSTSKLVRTLVTKLAGNKSREMAFEGF
jgi:hypothetical protein